MDEESKVHAVSGVQQDRRAHIKKDLASSVPVGILSIHLKCGETDSVGLVVHLNGEVG